MLKKCKVVMLPTSQKASVGNIVKVDNDIPDMCNGNLFDKGDLLVLTQLQKGLNRQQEGFTTQHLYILSEDEIKEEDWFVKIRGFNGKPSLYKEKEAAFLNSEWLNSPDVNDCFKVIASTDQSLELPEPSQAFINKYVDLYNKGQQIKEVNVEYEVYHGMQTSIAEVASFNSSSKWNGELLDNKLKVSNNTITIRKIKDSYTREEVVKLFDKLNNDLQTEYNVDCPYSVIEHWLKKNF